ncbi:hypothetical protein BHM03_00023241 [Ensete ventricosum]|nr:hypothetical protein BHM03_00023241 [Ensete ventricosum]
MSANNLPSLTADPLETRHPDPKAQSRIKSTSSSTGQPLAVIAPRHEKLMRNPRSGRGRCMMKTLTLRSSREARNLARGRLGTEPELDQMDGSPVSYPGGRLLEWWSSGREEAPQLGLGAGSCMEVGSGKCMSFYSECCRSFVPDNLTTLKAYHVIVPFYYAPGAYCEACVCSSSFAGKLRLASWSARMESAKELPEQPALSPCWKKKAPDAGFLANVKDHFDQFVGTSIDRHRICLKKTIRGVGDFVKLRKQGKVPSSSSSSKVVTESNSAAEITETTGDSP